MTDLWWREEGPITVTKEHIVIEMHINNRSLSETKGDNRVVRDLLSYYRVQYPCLATYFLRLTEMANGYLVLLMIEER